MSNLLRYFRLPYFVVLLLAFVCGCGGVQTEPVSGIVTMDGKPLPRVKVIFAPAEGGRAETRLERLMKREPIRWSTRFATMVRLRANTKF